MSNATIARSSGIWLTAYGVGTAIPFMGSGAPGGSYDHAQVADYVAAGHYAIAFTLWYVGALAALALVAFAVGVRRTPGVGPVLAGLTLVGAAVSVVGAFVSGGLDVAMAEGGAPIRSGVPGPVVYTITEIGNLLAVCAPALCVGVAACVLAARVSLPTWLRVFSVVAGVCGILAPFFFTYFVFLLWTIIAGIAVARSPRPNVISEPRPSLV